MIGLYLETPMVNKKNNFYITPKLFGILNSSQSNSNKISNEDLFITDQKVDTKKIYINDKMIVSPLPLDSEDNIRKRIHNIIDKNEISEEDKNKVIIRLKVSGYYQARDQLQTLIKKE